MTPEQRAREEELAAFIRANGECLAGADAVNRAVALFRKENARRGLSGFVVLKSGRPL